MLELKKETQYQLKKIGNRDEPELFNQDIDFDFTGIPTKENIEIGEVVFLNSPREYFRTSRIRSIYQHGTENDKLVLSSDFPIASDLKIPALKEGDILLATMNSIYLMRAVSE